MLQRIAQAARAAVQPCRMFYPGSLRPAVSVRAYSQATETPAPAPAPASSESEATPKVSLDSALEFTPTPTLSGATDTKVQPEMPVRDVLSVRGRSLPHRLHVKSTRNNTIVAFTMPTGEGLVRASGGSVGFRKAQRSGYEAGYRAALRVFQHIGANKKRWNVNAIEVVWNGFGQGREAVFRALQANEGELVRNMVNVMTDKTPIKIGGCRPKKRRML
ncbi:mitochondrial small ribosomal subunit protein [Malassezia pachydermatis]|uniref:37s ribosomal protein n=1 Tax=Malassezia pachydermatis TaxID=77020 RepID=A0A0M8MWY1_9BASI|nr:37s ribosomal protein [Malassezia pachydermatis]KOS15944.1 37s ribosomal protein [Malassezia pachydermatis]